MRLEPLERRHAAGLALAAEENRDSYAFTWVPEAADTEAYVEAQLARAATGTLAPYAQISTATGRVVGTTSYWEPRCWRAEDRLDAVEVGFTWLAASAQGTGVNTEAKYLLFRHAFEEWEVSRVDLKTDARTAVPAPRSSAPAPASRASCATGPAPGPRARRAGCATPRSTRSRPTSGRSAGPCWRSGCAEQSHWKDRKPTAP